MTTRVELNDVMDDLVMAYPEHGRKMSAQDWDRTCEVYFGVLRDVPLELLQSAARECVATLKWFPKPSEIREQALDLVMIALGIPTPNDAWAEVSRRMRNTFRTHMVAGTPYVELTGMYQVHAQGHLIPRRPTAEDWSTPLIQRAIDGIGGWAALQMSSNPVSDRAQFLRAYQQYSMRQLKAARLLPETKQAVLDWRKSGGLMPLALAAGSNAREGTLP